MSLCTRMPLSFSLPSSIIPAQAGKLGGSVRRNSLFLATTAPLSFQLSTPASLLLRAASTAVAELGVPLEEGSPTIKEKNAAELTLSLLEWPRLLLIVSSFAGTESAKEIIQDLRLPSTQWESENLLSETTAAISLLSFLGGNLDFGSIQSKLVDLCLIRLQKGFVIKGQEAVAIATLLQLTDTLQHDIKTSMKQNMDFENPLKALLDTICTMGAQPDVNKAIAKTVDEDGNVKDSASPELQRARVQYRMLGAKVQELLRSMLKEQEGNTSTQEIDGRFCIAVSSENQKDFPGLLLKSSNGGSTSYIEPVALVSLNDKLAEARASILKAEYEALRLLTNKMLPHVENLISLLEAIIQLDVVLARAKFSLMYEGTLPTFTTETQESDYNELGKRTTSSADVKSGKRTFLQLRQTYHPLLLHQYREHVRIQKTKHGKRKNEAPVHQSPPMPIDIIVSGETRVIVITGPNTGGKTAAMKTLGLTALMANCGFYVLAKEPAYLPWFDAVFGDIGDEQSLAQSLSTFSGHLRRINHIKQSSTGDSLVLLDEVGTGTNPLEGAALGMAILESFASNGPGGARLTLASTHHAELKTLKYSDCRFENASVEFDEETLKPTYRLLWGVPGRSNALNISERLGVPKTILEAAKRHLGGANFEINQVIMDLENSKRDFENSLFEAEQYLKKAKLLHRSILEAAELVSEEEQASSQLACSMLQEEAHKARALLSAIHQKRLNMAGEKSSGSNTLHAHAAGKPVTSGGLNTLGERSSGSSISPQTPAAGKLATSGGSIQIGDMVFVPKLGKEVKVVQVSTGKRTLFVQSGSLQLRLSFSDITKNGRG